MRIKDLSYECKYKGCNDVFWIVTVLELIKQHNFKSICNTKTSQKSYKLSKKSYSNFDAEQKHDLSCTKSEANEIPANIQPVILAVNSQVEWQD